MGIQSYSAFDIAKWRHADKTGQPPRLAELRLMPEKLFRLLLLCVAGLVAAGIAVNIARFGFGSSSPIGFGRLLDLDQEGNIPTWFSSKLLFVAAGLLALIAGVAKAERWHWFTLSAIFMALSLDETAAIHERAISPLRHALDLSGPFYFAWVLPALLCLAVFVLSYQRFLTALPARTAALFILSGSVYVAGALGMEMVGGSYASTHGTNSIIYASLTTIEETLEMLGVTLFIYALCDYLRSLTLSIAFRWSD